MNFVFWFWPPFGFHFGGVLGAQMEAKAFKTALKKTSKNSKLQINLALNYGSKLELIDAFKKIQIAGHPEGNKDIDKDGTIEKTINALKAKQQFAQKTKLQIGITTQFCFDLRPVMEWLEVLESEQINLPISLGLAGPTKLQTLIKYAIMCGVGPSISVLKKRAKDLTKLLLPFEPTEMVDALNSNKKNKLFKNVNSLHFFPLGGIEASAAFARNIDTPA